MHLYPCPLLAIGWKLVSSLVLSKLDLGWLETSKENLQKKLPLSAQDDAKVHNAVYDARYQAEILAALLNLPKRSI